MTSHKIVVASLISIHAPSRERPIIGIYVTSILSISIHAPSRERRRRLHRHDNSTPHFNPRSLAGATLSYCASVTIKAFQSTLPRGSDATTRHAAHRHAQHFNPRSLAGATCRSRGNTRLPDISIHAPSRERPCSILLVTILSSISIHAPSRERRQPGSARSP